MRLAIYDSWNMNRYQTVLWAILLAAAVGGSIGSEFPQQMLLQHFPTAAMLILLPIVSRRIPLSNAAFTCVVVFILLHVIGARYIYSYVPYDQWSERLFDVNVTQRFGFRRNHFDRLVHFAFGVLAARPVWEVLTKVFKVPPRFAFYAAFEFVLAFSLLYELFEWGLTIVLSPDDAGAYNGEQGDIWDAHRDMSFAVLGVLLSLTFWRVLNFRTLPRNA